MPDILCMKLSQALNNLHCHAQNLQQVQWPCTYFVLLMSWPDCLHNVMQLDYTATTVCADCYRFRHMQLKQDVKHDLSMTKGSKVERLYLVGCSADKLLMIYIGSSQGRLCCLACNSLVSGKHAGKWLRQPVQSVPPSRSLPQQQLLHQLC